MISEDHNPYMTAHLVRFTVPPKQSSPVTSLGHRSILLDGRGQEKGWVCPNGAHTAVAVLRFKLLKEDKL